MKIKILMWMILVFALVGGVLAAPLSTVLEQGKVGLTVTTGMPEVLKFNSSDDIYFHVYNSSDALLNNSQANCSIQIYNNSNGVSLSDNNLIKQGNDDFYSSLNYSLMKNIGNYPFIVTCNSVQNQFGFLRGEIVLTVDGQPVNFDSFILAAVFILIPLIFGWLMLSWCVSLGDDHAVIKIFMSIFSLMNIFLSLWFAVLSLIRFIAWDAMQDGLTSALWVYGIIFFVIISYFIIYLIIKAFRTAAKAKIERLKY